MRIDLTIYLGGTIATDGGVIMVLPTAVPPNEFVVPDDLPNPANDLVVASDADQIILGADVFAQKSIVTFYYPEGVPYTYRFRTRDPEIDWSKIRTDRIGTGFGNGVHPITGEVEPYEIIFTHHFDVGSWTMAQSREADATTNLGFLSERYPCERFAAVQVCDATFDRIEP
ncbi:hypothetical protein [Roseinatronobacter alkalisoli]|uniref:Uncharacterized protein n=1 Tax=Roseinatronobacter alkalisoli TaxID=3028235 RepID=A0ABT5TFH6_9RHOB|nr:hypothetical protein [Roseinatronobacter sp. HJB301]MDD7973868.1 hypothetical protein [Roseinatronobacter sp. HJB301]